jgi:hypothetical protein
MRIISRCKCYVDGGLLCAVDVMRKIIWRVLVMSCLLMLTAKSAGKSVSIKTGNCVERVDGRRRG